MRQTPRNKVVAQQKIQLDLEQDKKEQLELIFKWHQELQARQAQVALPNGHHWCWPSRFEALCIEISTAQPEDAVKIKQEPEAIKQEKAEEEEIGYTLLLLLFVR